MQPLVDYSLAQILKDVFTIFEFHERNLMTTTQSESIANLAAALVAAQSQMGGAKKSSANPYFKSKYADLSECLDVASKPLADNGLAVTQSPITEMVEGTIMAGVEIRIRRGFLCPSHLGLCRNQCGC